MANAMVAVKSVPNKFDRVRLELNGYQYMVKNNRSDRRYQKCSPVMSSYSQHPLRDYHQKCQLPYTRTNNLYIILVCLFVKFYILLVFYMNIFFMFIYVVHLPYLTYQCFLMKYDNKYFLLFSNMSFIYTGFTVSLITGKFL